MYKLGSQQGVGRVKIKGKGKGRTSEENMEGKMPIRIHSAGHLTHQYSIIPMTDQLPSTTNINWTEHR